MTARPSPGLRALVEANAPYWGGEAEVCVTYFRSPSRTAATDRLWLLRQCYKEMVDGVVFRLLAMQGAYPVDALGPGGVPVDEDTRTEVAHFLAYADALRVLDGPDAPPLDTATLLAADWDENRALMQLRREHHAAWAEPGRRAYAFTEGGYCTLYRVGMALGEDADAGPVDRAIAAASRVVYDDEWGHMLEGIAGLEDHRMSDADWARLRDLSVEQSRARIRMRNAQFSHPVSAARMAELEAGRAEPVVFDWHRAGFTPPDA